jgi:hypothetical protein
MALILDPEKWERPALLELAESQDADLAGIFDAFNRGLVVAPNPKHREAAMELLRTTLDLYQAARESLEPDLALVRLINLQYQTMLTVTVLVPPTLMTERFKRQALKGVTNTESTTSASDGASASR